MSDLISKHSLHRCSGQFLDEYQLTYNDDSDDDHNNNSNHHINADDHSSVTMVQSL